MNLIAIIPAGLKVATVNGLTQWDYGRKLEIRSDDLPALVEVHFACDGMQTAIVRACEATGGVAEATIPDICLEQTSPVTAWVYAIGESSGETIQTITMPIQARVRPQTCATPPEEISDKYTEAVAAMNAAVDSLKEGDVMVNRAKKDSAGNVIVDTYGKFPSTFTPLSDDKRLPNWGWYYIQARNKGLETALAGTLGGLIHFNGTEEDAPIVNVTAIDREGKECAIQIDKLSVSMGGVITVTMIYSDASAAGMDITNRVTIEYIRIL